MSDFTMPPRSAGFEVRGAYVLAGLMAEFGLTKEQAAGIVGNIGYESIGFSTLQEIEPSVSGSRGGYGWAQWTGPRRRAFEGWCEEQGLKPWSDEANYGYLVFELNYTQQHVIEQLHKTTTLEAAVFTVGAIFERPGGTTPSYLPGFDGRLGYAKKALKGMAEMVDATPAPVEAPLVPEDFFSMIRRKLGL